MKDWQSLVDLRALNTWMEQQGLGKGDIENPLPLAGGTQNLLLRFQRHGKDYVLRRPPRHLRANSNDTMRREMRLLAALADTNVPHPRLLAACPEEDVIGVAFYLMEPIDGFNATCDFPESHGASADQVHRMGLSLVEGITALGAVDYEKVGLSGFGKPEGFLERQVPRWRAQLESYQAFSEWPGADGIPGVDRVGQWLERHRPDTFQPGIIHGDYHLANVLYCHDRPELAAIVDWELTTIGDPLIDLGWLLATTPDHLDLRINQEGDSLAAAFPDRQAMIEHYRTRSGRDLSHIEWYGVLACYKLGLILEGTYARACAGKAPMETGERLHNRTITLFERALGWIS
ncbi:Phosphotransferase enzyme family protein [Alloalcanivorax dieselolei B5]|uniref:Phosphotransferase enzyme family protein n=1 Tax=Alcanivorax dieselolei (strain DSM 16502 / CGMCC 1.3690 / MCCC 1A00001 / B-5) TaxID=930169 RepID=K0CF55_ALCDB|nr:phosphotransferase family protein [Alloalcanivorax dieselolei]AFT70287.1 Phosphotransferase enzyme family protein [Alloalcanivorax dieselolei B5]GGK09734.1 putative aminoglycoside phosphotransferase [Alloalcanivorax dieselolei]